MSSIKFLIITLLAFCVASPLARAQQLPASWQLWIDHQQELMDDDATLDLDYIAELYETLSDSPINLNDTTDTRLANLPFIGDLRARIVRAYIEQHGQLFTIEEIVLLNSFNASIVDMLRPVTVVEPYTPPDRLTARQLYHGGRHRVDIGMSENIERATGYSNGAYEGSPLHLSARYQYTYRNRIHLSISADKDAGEAFFSGSQTQGFDHYGGYLIINKLGIADRTIIGHYNLQFGQGLTLWTGFASFGTAQADNSRYGRGIVAASPFAEYGYLQGAATTLALSPRFNLTAFYSNVRRDANADTSGVVHSLSSSGLHRTEAELSHKKQLREQLYGLNLSYNARSMTVGLTVAHTLLSDSIQPYNYKYNYYAFNSNCSFNAGVDARVRLGRILLYGEGSVDGGGALAGLAGATFALSPTRQLGISLHSYAADYYNLHHAAPSRTSVAGGERGLRICYQTQLPLSVNASCEVEGYTLSTLRYRLYAPSHGAVYRLMLSRPMGRHSTLTLAYALRQSMRNRVSDSVAEYVVEDISRHHVSADLRIDLAPIMLRTHAVATFHSTESTINRGFLIYQDVAYSALHQRLRLSCRAALFNTTAYDARISAIESSLAYQLSSTTFNGRGLRLYAIARYDVSHSLRLSARYALTVYPSVESIGTGNELTEGNHRQEVQLQLMWRF